MLSNRKLAGAAAVLLMAACQDGPNAPGPVVMNSWTVDAGTGIGFVGKGDVQDIYAWNNKQLQDNANSVQFRMNSELVTEVSWTCTNGNNQQEQVRLRTTTNTSQGVLSTVARKANQVNGFNLTGYSGSPVVTSETGGPPLNSCPSGPWSLTTPAGDPVVVSQSGGGLQVSINGTDWFTVPAPVIVP